MKSLQRWYVSGIVGLLMIVISTSSWAVIILESTYKQYGFDPAEALALEPQFSSLIFLDGESSSGSGSWIGNYQGHGYVLTAGHMFPPGTKANDYTYEAIDGTEYDGDAVYLHPLWNESSSDRTGYDFAIVRLTEEVTDVGPQPALYSGNDEKGKILTFIGYGWRGAGKKGEDATIDTENEPAAAEGLVESVDPAVEPIPTKGDAGNYLAVWLPKEDGSIANPITDKGITKPISPLAGILGSGDSGGPAWIQTDNGWAIAGVNSDGSENASYGNSSWFPRITHVQEWIKQFVPNAKFIK
ncbi:trypsin-like peptidase domain-containing protein [Legionella waltersii]|uniref:Trypsin n=1 Tax=Legionella waltersii TaxID=66969 RepID=A0A0W1A1V2_9GAMM|nr:trypsin-like peptidase domain-containing protein [Legionella waltersii]KTD75288.1 Trypsin [Legionella waltersii]SNV06941.1 V8-like Glu-specific endopeptidase [Legionella waltersii]